MKNKLLLTCIFFGMLFLFIPNVYADGFYYEYNGSYILCESEDPDSCGAVSKDDNTLNYDASIGRIIYNNKIYNFSSIEQEKSTTWVTVKDESNNTSSDNGTSKQSTCVRLKEPLKFIGNIVLIVKIFIPIILIFLGAMDLFKAVTAGKDDELKKSLRIFALRCVAGIAIFFLPTIISFVFSLVSSWASLKGDFNQCQKYVLNVRNSD